MSSLLKKHSMTILTSKASLNSDTFISIIYYYYY